ncbi:hypothetical protein X943_000977 [Babesia divergens]|uniref:Uncharacterized protein n=1 Tax=Babesia divergens TaxID=32595 RepID=A0AAD9GK03_BABDI|nr:hypothetical protein X943_000977 [Babesia divergens]
MTKGMSKLLASIERDAAYSDLKDSLSSQIENGKLSGSDVWKRIVRGVVNAMAKVDKLDMDAEINAECLVMIEDIATYGRSSYPWMVAKMLLIVAWSHLFNELYDSEVGTVGFKYDQQRFTDEKKACLALLLKCKQPPITLQRLSEILLKQPYKNISKLFHAYRKVVSVGAMSADESASYMDEELEASDSMITSKANLSRWESEIIGPDQQGSDADIWLEESDSTSLADTGPMKRPLNSA